VRKAKAASTIIETALDASSTAESWGRFRIAERITPATKSQGANLNFFISSPFIQTFNFNAKSVGELLGHFRGLFFLHATMRSMVPMIRY
jgi:hypothetical protein